MKDTAIIFSWKDNGEIYQKEIDREAFYSMFDGLAKGFEKEGDNRVSKKLIKIIPDANKIFINKDINRTQDDPFIVYYISGEEPKILKIKRCNDIVWGILLKYCK